MAEVCTHACIYEEAWREILGIQWDEVASSGTSACMLSIVCTCILRVQMIFTRVA